MVNRNLRIVFMGTPEFAVPSLQILLEAGYTIAGVVTATDKMGGRGQKEKIISAVKSFASGHGLKIFQPEKLKSKEFIEELKNLEADLQVVVAFRMLPETVWNMPRLGTMNLHASLLPAYRGAAPIQWAIIRGEKMTGLTTFLLEHAIDTGNIIAQREIPILDGDTAGTLHDRMMHAGAGLVLGSVDAIASGKISTYAQDNSKASHAPRIHREDAQIDWTASTTEILNLIRGMSPFPGAWTMLDGKEFKILGAKAHTLADSHLPGKITISGQRMITGTADSSIEILEVQLEGKKRMPVSEFLKGYRIKIPQMT